MNGTDVADELHGQSTASASAPALAPEASSSPTARSGIDWQPPLEGTAPTRLHLFVEGAELVSLHDLTGDLQAVTLRAGGRDWTFHAHITHGRETPPGPARFLWVNSHEARIVPCGSEEQDRP